MKIKTKKKFKLPQLIEWVWKNGIDSKAYISSRGSEIYFDEYGNVVEVYRIEPNAVFTVRVEEEITEDTVLPKLLERWKRTDEEGAFRYTEHKYKNINKILSSNDAMVKLTHFYTENDDGELVLIWREGEMVK